MFCVELAKAEKLACAPRLNFFIVEIRVSSKKQNVVSYFIDLAQHYLLKANITCLRRLRKSDNNRISRACGATVVNRTDEIREEDIGTGCGLFEIRKIGEEFYAFIEKCTNPKACTIILRGASKDVLNEVERNETKKKETTLRSDDWEE